jgi:hypothetical protein
MRCYAPLIAMLLTLAACTEREPEKFAVTTAAPAQDPTVVPRPVREATLAPPVAPVTVSPGALYLCVTDAGQERRQTTIELAPKVAELCRKAPEMSPCQYERENCRRSGGRVFAADGTEITRRTEAEYDKRVMRARFKSN